MITQTQQHISSEQRLMRRFSNAPSFSNANRFNNPAQQAFQDAQQFNQEFNRNAPQLQPVQQNQQPGLRRAVQQSPLQSPGATIPEDPRQKQAFIQEHIGFNNAKLKEYQDQINSILSQTQGTGLENSPLLEQLQQKMQQLAGLNGQLQQMAGQPGAAVPEGIQLGDGRNAPVISRDLIQGKTESIDPSKPVPTPENIKPRDKAKFDEALKSPGEAIFSEVGLKENGQLWSYTAMDSASAKKETDNSDNDDSKVTNSPGNPVSDQQFLAFNPAGNPKVQEWNPSDGSWRVPPNANSLQSTLQKRYDKAMKKLTKDGNEALQDLLDSATENNEFEERERLTAKQGIPTPSTDNPTPQPGVPPDNSTPPSIGQPPSRPPQKPDPIQRSPEVGPKMPQAVIQKAVAAVKDRMGSIGVENPNIRVINSYVTKKQYARPQVVREGEITTPSYYETYAVYLQANNKTYKYEQHKTDPTREAQLYEIDKDSVPGQRSRTTTPSIARQLQTSGTRNTPSRTVEKSTQRKMDTSGIRRLQSVPSKFNEQQTSLFMQQLSTIESEIKLSTSDQVHNARLLEDIADLTSKLPGEKIAAVRQRIRGLIPVIARQLQGEKRNLVAKNEPAASVTSALQNLQLLEETLPKPPRVVKFG